eukprot:g483.t1
MTCVSLVPSLGGYFVAVYSLLEIWQGIWQKNEHLDKKSLLLRSLVRFAKAVCALCYWYGWKTDKSTGIAHNFSFSEFDKVSRKALASVKAKPYPEGTANVAVVIPCLCVNERDTSNIRRALACIRQQTLKPRYTFLVDDGSPVPITEQLTEGERKGVTFLRLDANCGPSTARNTGLRAARATDVDFVCFTDADCRPVASWVENIVTHFEQNPVDDIIGGLTTSIHHKSFVETFHDCFGTLNGPQLPDQTLLYGPTCNLAVRLRTVFVEFDPRFNEASFEDVEFCVKARQAGAVLRLAPNVIVQHNYDLTLLGMAKQYARYGRGFNKMSQIHPSFSSWHSNAKLTPIPF